MDDRKRLLLGYEVDIDLNPGFASFYEHKKEEEIKFQSTESLIEWLKGNLPILCVDANLSVYGLVEMQTCLHTNIHTFEREEILVVIGHELPPRSDHYNWDYLFDAITKLITIYDNKVCKDHLEYIGFNKGQEEPV